jgi:subtilisin family serine protease
MVAASGNDGAADVAFPASDPNVIAVSAVDAAGRIYSRANRGEDVDFVAPGVDVLVIEGQTATYRSGTSYAAAAATGVIAHLFAGGARSGGEIADLLRDSARDLGTPGHDRMFGWGLLQLQGCPR